jgi:phosphatidylinositol glycan class O
MLLRSWPLLKPLLQRGCWTPPHFKRAVVLLVDALRFDFVVPRTGRAVCGSLVCLKLKLPSSGIVHLADAADCFGTDGPLSALLLVSLYLRCSYDNIAALARLDHRCVVWSHRALIVAGSFPTFIESAFNFNSAAVTEDNLLHQLRLRNRTAVFMGDDTWMGRFPEAFARR